MLGININIKYRKALNASVMSTIRFVVSRRDFCSWRCEKYEHSGGYVNIFESSQGQKDQELAMNKYG